MRVPSARSGAWLILAGFLACDQPDPAVQRSSAGAQAATAQRAEPQPAAQSAVDASRRTALVTATERVSAAVVSINTRSRRDLRARSPWDFFFVPERSRLVEGYGTGFVVRPNGIIITNQHVVANAERVVVTLPDGTDLPAKVLGEDPLTDIAVLKVDREGLPRCAPAAAPIS
jgi:S1-C subfamily serine protease